ncbi:MAG: decarboxylating NADP(+)-dependent phosphogluconate dehydrogenase [Ilumatobacter sp.]|nr:decarboxylating NADP(+)-dependent phosphogluconate dehydrogenase [Ilumatobacter sp.]
MHHEPRADIGLIGLAVMGQNLVLNMSDHGFTVAVYNRTASVTDEFVSGRGQRDTIVGCGTLDELVASLKPPRRVMMMVQAGAAVDAVIDHLSALLDPGDIIIDGGNSLYTDSIRRTAEVEGRGLRYIGTGVSGGEEGARHGPSIMPGGSAAAWRFVEPIFQAVAAKTADGTPCCDWVGADGAGHYVKMVHNGIEYGDMQVTAEAYALMKAAGMGHSQMSGTFRTWGDGVLDSYLVDITADILAFTDDDGEPLVERILDAAGQKGTGKWMVISSMELGQPVTLVAEAVYARIVSSLKDQRVRASSVLAGPDGLGIDVSVDDIHDALYASKIVSYAQGFMLLRAAAEEHGWELDLGRIASLWREGCIIRARFLDDITAAYERDPDLENLLLDPFFAEAVNAAQAGWRRVVAAAVAGGIAVPAYSAALAFYDGYRSEHLPANLIQAQRDYFGAHTYERVDRPRGEVFHTNWTGRGGDTTARAYQV